MGTLFENENEWQKTELIPIQLPRASIGTSPMTKQETISFLPFIFKQCVGPTKLDISLENDVNTCMICYKNYNENKYVCTSDGLYCDIFLIR